MKQNETKKCQNADSLHNFICEHCCNEFRVVQLYGGIRKL